MTSYHWNHPERRDLYLAARMLAKGEPDGDWRQWASDTLIEDLELYDDPRQGAGAWLAKDEVDLAAELGKQLWEVVEADPFNAADELAEPNPTLSAVAAKLVERIESNGRAIS